MAEQPKSHLNRLAAPLIEIFGLSRGLAISVVLLGGLLIAAAVYWFIHSAPPDTITISAGAPGSSFAANAERYRTNLEAKGITLKILPSSGSRENLQRLNDPSTHVDIGFVQGGVTNDPSTNTLVSLGSITYEPLLVFYRSRAPITLLSGFAGRRVAIGPEGSATRSLALQLLAFNEIKPGGETSLEDLDGDAAAEALLAGTVDAVFLMSDSTSTNVMRELLRSSTVQLFDFTQADAYTRKISYLNKLVMPQGAIDIGKNLPAHDVNLVGPTVEIVARPNLHPALSDLLLEVAQFVHNPAGTFKRRNEFPVAIKHDFPISDDASRYYDSGKKSFFYRKLPFWLASRISRVLVAFVPLIVLLIPAVRIVPAAFKWRMRMRINRWYRALLALERSIPGGDLPSRKEQLMAELERIESEVNKMKVPASFADQFYGLRGHIIFVRDRLMHAPA